MGHKNPLLVSYISLALAGVFTLASLSVSVRAQEVSAMISPEEMRKPLRAISITFGPGDQDEIIHRLRTRADQIHFASRASSDPAHPDDLFLQLYRSDIKLIGHLIGGAQRLDLVLYRNIGLPEPASEIDFVLKMFREAVSAIASARFSETVFEVGDDFSKFSRQGVSAAFGGQISFSQAQLFLLTDALSNFAISQGMAVRFHQITPDPRTFSVDMYMEGLMISGSNLIPTDPLDISIYKTGDRKISSEAVAATLSELKHAVEAVPGVTFTLVK